MTVPVSSLDPTTSAMPTDRKFIHRLDDDTFYEVIQPMMVGNQYLCAGSGGCILLIPTTRWPMVSNVEAAAGRLRGATIHFADRIKEN